MTEFGKLLRALRKECSDPDYPGRKLSQARLGELLGRELDLQGGYSGAAVSDWERGKSKIHADQRLVLVSLIKILHEHGGILSCVQANEFLGSGNYRALDPTETQKASFREPQDATFEAPSAKPRQPASILQFFTERIFADTYDEMQPLLADAKVGPAPFWPRVFIAFLRRFLDHWSVTRILRLFFWLWVWLFTWVVIEPSLRWPFASREAATVAIVLYAGGSLVVPLLIGLLTNTKHDQFWREHNLADTPETRLYTHQGASVGFHLGYFGTFTFGLLGYYAHLQSAVWVEFTAMAVILFLGYVGARLIPYNVWRGYGRLDLADGGVFFIFMLLGPLWGYYFLEFYPVFLNSIFGGLTILCVITLSILTAAWQQYRRGLART